MRAGQKRKHVDLGVRQAKLTKRCVDGLKPETKRYRVNDTELPGFNVMVQPNGREALNYRYRVGGGRGAMQRELRIGLFGELTVEEARNIAHDWAADVRRGGDPATERRTALAAERMNELFDRYMSEHADKKKRARSAAEDRRIIDRYLLPTFGGKKVTEVTRPDIARFMSGMSDRPIMASRCLGLLSKVFNLAEMWRARPDGTNSCLHAEKFKENKRERYLTPVEFGRLAEAMREAERGEVIGDKRKPIHVNPFAIAALRLLALSGCRKEEILSMRWDDVNLAAGRLELQDSKTGRRTVQLNSAAQDVLAALPRVEGNPHVIVGGKPGAALVNLSKPWRAIREAAGLSDVHLHDLRHSYASVAVGEGMSLPMVGKLLGHSQPATTQRYAHLADDPQKAASETVGRKIAEAMGRDVDSSGEAPAAE